jgi:hypothetical protein
MNFNFFTASGRRRGDLGRLFQKDKFLKKPGRR